MPGKTRSDLRREKLLARIEGATEAQLLLIHAPAGFGKSTLLRQIADQAQTAGCQVGWITPTLRDVELPRLVQLFSAACERLLTERAAPPAPRDLPASLIHLAWVHRARNNHDAARALVAEALETGETVKLSGFGVFQVRDKRARMGRNPKTGEPAEIEPRRVIGFRASQVMKARIDRALGG